MTSRPCFQLLGLNRRRSSGTAMPPSCACFSPQCIPTKRQHWSQLTVSRGCAVPPTMPGGTRRRRKKRLWVQSVKDGAQGAR